MPTRNGKVTKISSRSAQQGNTNYCEGDESSPLESIILFNGVKLKRYLAKELIYREGESVDKVCVIRSGLVKLLSYLPNGRARIVRLHGAGQWVGLEGVVGQPCEHTAIAVGDVELYYISLGTLRHLEQDNPRQFSQILRQGYKHLSQADRWIADFSTGGIKPRVARLVDFLSKLEHGESSHIVELLTVHEMADILGVTAESVSRILAAFKRNQILCKQGNPSGEYYRINAGRLQEEARR
ncbi:MAG: Crp/Fnr family transcriptional regulator [Granulosicoccaceae bacterium]|jgi:CRP/FNR family transcriptional regulator